MDQSQFETLLERHYSYCRAKKARKKIPENAKRLSLYHERLDNLDFNNKCLDGASFYGCVLPYTLRNASFRGSIFTSCNLAHCDFTNTILKNINFIDCWLPSPTMLLLANWEAVSEELTVDLMNYDAACHPNPRRFAIWAGKGTILSERVCPYSGYQIHRACTFSQNPKSYNPKRELQRPIDLLTRLFKEKNIHHKDINPAP